MGELTFLDVAAGNRELRDELQEAYEAVLDGPTLILGDHVRSFERAFAASCGAAHCVGVGSGFDALELALRALGVGAGDDVLVPSHTYIATWLAVSAVGARPVPVEPDLGTATIDVDRLDAAWTERTRAVIPVHLYGRPAEMAPLLTWARRRDVRVLADAAQAHGATYRGEPIGALGDAVAWSFYPTKNLGALGDGGAVTTGDAALAEQLRRLRSYGRTERDVHVEQGVNSRLDELQAALLEVKLARLEAWNARRRSAAARYLHELADLALDLPEARPEGQVWHQFVVRSPGRDALRARLAERGVPTMVHYPTPPFAQPAYAGLDVGADLPLARRLADEVLSLPIGPHLDEAAQGRVIDALRTLVPRR